MEQRARIQAMPAALREMIAAGEVIERPASVVKELVENSLDAGAGEIEVRVERGGKTVIEVADDGHGIHPDDMRLAIVRHATSKLTSVDDLTRIATFGFRGEALASIAAVASILVESRCAELSEAAAVSAQPGAAPTGPFPAARARGTRVVVRDLFSALPARRKFLRSDATELGRVRETLRIFCIAHPEVGFRLFSGGRESLNAPPATLADRLRDLIEVQTDWLEIDAETARLRVTGLVSHPHVSHGGGGDLHVFVNRRYVRDRLLRKAVLSAFESTLAPGQWPYGAVFIDLPPEEVDVNVHPAKTEVRFRDPGDVFAAVRTSLEQAVTAGRRPPGRAAPVRPPSPLPGRTQTSGTWTTTDPAPGEPWVSDRGAPWPISPAENKSVPVQDSLTAEDLQPVPLGAVGQRYLLFLEGGSLVIVDQHAAHERIRYDAIIAALRGAAAPSQELLVADVFRAEPQEVEGLAAGRDWLARVGFAVELFGPETLRIRAVPVWFRGDPRPAVRETLRDLAEHGGGDAIERHAHELAARLACRGAILSGRDVPRREQEDLLRSLLTTPGADTCPHGRPTWRRITGGELDRWFGRT